VDRPDRRQGDGTVTPLVPAVLAGLSVLLLLPPRRASGRAGGVVRPRGALSRPSDRSLPVLTGAGIAAGTILLVGGGTGVVLGLVAGGLGWAVARRLEPPAVRRRREQLTAGLPHAVDLMAASLGAGQAPATAVELVALAVAGPLREELLLVATRLRLGTDPTDVWAELAAHPQLGRLGRCVARSAESGTAVADAMERLAQDLRRDARAVVEERARGVGVRAALPLGVCLLPAFLLVGVVPLVAGSFGALLTR
jgi:Flp pilus assembly protein TadB